MPRLPKLEWDRLIKVMGYDPDSGIFTWKIRRNGKLPPSMIAGTVDTHGHRIITVDQVRYMAHRLAWFYVHKQWPPHEIDHINRSRDDNRISNLRLAERWQQRANQKIRIDCLTGFKGVKKHKNGKTWYVRCTKHGVVTRRYGFNSPEEASVAYQELAKTNFGDYAAVM